MEVIFLSKTHGSRGRLHFGWLSGLTAVFVIICGLAWGAYTVYRSAAQHHADNQLTEAMKQKETWAQELAEQRKLVRAATETAQSNFDALAMRLGEMQAHLSRLNAFAARMGEMTNISAEEFNFGSTPAVGGPAVPVSGDSLKVLDFAKSLERLTKDLNDKEQELTALESLLLRRKVQAEILPGGQPVLNGWVSSGFGTRTNPVTGKRELHRGLDFAGPSGSEVLAVAEGLVTWSDRRDAYGNFVEIDHGNGYVTRYAHNQKNLVAVGDKVEKGQIIALMGSTGRSTGPHIHFEVVRDGKVVNPRAYIDVAGH